LSSSKDPGIGLERKTVLEKVLEKALDEALDESESAGEGKFAPETASSWNEPRKESMRLARLVRRGWRASR
jgi:hypothetical protein